MAEQIIVVPNPDKEIAESVMRAIKNNGGYCPCKLEKTPDTKCVCTEFKEQINRGEDGQCHCGLYTAVRCTEKKSEDDYESAESAV